MRAGELGFSPSRVALALGFSPFEAAEAARRITAEAVRDGLRELGEGPGPVNVLGL